MSDSPPVRYIYRLRAGAGPEYDRRHQEVWPELLELLSELGVHDYTIWRRDEIVVCFLRLREPFDETARLLAQNEIQSRWTASLAHLFEEVADGDGRPLLLTETFRLEPR